MADSNPRPSKRLRRDSSPADLTVFSSQSTLTPPPSSEPGSPPPSPSLKPLPAGILLVALPSLLAAPPNHRKYVQSLDLSLQALRQCLSLPALSPEIESRAWCGLAEVGMKVISGGFSEEEAHPWAHDVEAEVDKAIGKATVIAQKHPSLRPLKIHLSLLQVQLSQWQHKIKFARTQLRNLISSLKSTDSPHLVYSAHLAAISLYSAPKPPSAISTDFKPTTQPSQDTNRLQDVHAALSAVHDMEMHSVRHQHARITLLAQVLRLRILVAFSIWQDIEGVIGKIEKSLGLSYIPSTMPKPRQASVEEGSKEDSTFISFESPLEAAMAVHALMMAVIYFTHIGSAGEAAPRLSHLHALLDSEVLTKFPDGTVEVILPEGPPLIVQVTHPSILYQLGFLVSSVAKRDAVGRKPKRKLFANEGLAAWERDISQEIPVPLWAGRSDIEEVEKCFACVKGDLLCELIAVSIMRSEFDAAEEHLNVLIAHTRSNSVFSYFSARITLHHAHLAHALNQTPRALACYRVAACSAGHDDFVSLSAQAGEAILLLGLESGKENDASPITEGRIGRKEAMSIAKACRCMGGTLEAVGQVLEALVSPEILRAKEHLKRSLELATKSQDNHLRAGVLALVAAHYFHTAGDHAYKMLLTCEQLAAGLGALSAKSLNAGGSSTSTGNASLGLWVGQKLLELYKRAGKEERVQKQIVANQWLDEAVRLLAARNGVGGKATDG
ncbi:hypothetical protein BDY19DRAFT_880730 [Irpex rosettiformis]|uniref:Uncharacterized protein n=1 Tax=Irpex rosettiformis TaxID=378272 RepID=A0ACB8ULH5_9APHY|nr:hypothetical protein BDY19DRAFT_880730 [Irpex rosettiformis]